MAISYVYTAFRNNPNKTWLYAKRRESSLYIISTDFNLHSPILSAQSEVALPLLTTRQFHKKPGRFAGAGF